MRFVKHRPVRNFNLTREDIFISP